MITVIIVGVICLLVGGSIGFLACAMCSAGSKQDDDVETVFGSVEESDATLMSRG